MSSNLSHKKFCNLSNFYSKSGLVKITCASKMHAIEFAKLNEYKFKQ